MYLFQNHMQDDCRLHVNPNTLTSELREVGFEIEKIHEALDWLDGLIELQDQIEQVSPPSEFSFHLYSPCELTRLDDKCRGFLLQLENNGILSPTSRELVIDRLMSLDERHIALYQVKWVTLMVLFNRPDEKAALANMEQLVLADSLGALH